MKKPRFLAALVVAALFGSSLIAADSTGSAEAATAADFNAGMIISDALFYDGESMSAASIQEFLNGQVAQCTSGYTCLKGYRQDTFTRSAVSGRCGQYVGGTQESSATIIYKVGLACGISQKAILVLLQKEQSLVTSSAPSTARYRSATGYGCPDTADCDSAYYGFFNQVYMAALQFKRYAASPEYWNHVPGRVNTVRFHPNAACGASAVYIENKATAGLYNYTPYQPNAAALANFYGVGDACSSYGNRNFARIYTDWFGSTHLSTLLRTTSSPKVWLISGEIKHLVPSVEILKVLSPLGGVDLVSQSYLDGFQTGTDAGRVYRATSGKIYFTDSAIKLPFVSCDQVSDYGGSCGQTGYVQLTDAQIATFVLGPPMLSVLATTAGSRYYIKDGVRREILDDISQAGEGIPLGQNVLTEAAVAGLPLAQPVARDQVFVHARETGSVSLFSNGRYSLSQELTQQVGAANKSAGALNSASIELVGKADGSFSGVVSADGGTSLYVLTSEGRALLAEPLALATTPFTPVSSTLLQKYVEIEAISEGAFVKSAATNTVFVVTDTQLRPVSSWNALVSIAGSSSPLIHTLPLDAIQSSPLGLPVLKVGGLYRTAGNAAVFAIDGLGSRVSVANFIDTSEAGLSGYELVAEQTLSAYESTNRVWQSGFVCGEKRFVSSAGELREVVTDQMLARYPITFIDLDKLTCNRLTFGSPAKEFIRTADGKIYILENGTKRPFNSYSRFVELNTGRGWTSVSYRLASLIPTGAAA